MYAHAMCGRIIQSSRPLRYAIVDGMNVRDSRVNNYPPRWNAAPSQELLVIRRNHQTGEVSLDPLRWSLIPYWCTDPNGGRKPINAKYETVQKLPTFRDECRKRRRIVDGFFEWKAIKGQRAKQPYAIAMKDGAPFGLAGRIQSDAPYGPYTFPPAETTKSLSRHADRSPALRSYCSSSTGTRAGGFVLTRQEAAWLISSATDLRRGGPSIWLSPGTRPRSCGFGLRRRDGGRSRGDD
jgi:putative SOS response-associated peptidase YedK